MIGRFDETSTHSCKHITCQRQAGGGDGDLTGCGRGDRRFEDGLQQQRRKKHVIDELFQTDKKFSRKAEETIECPTQSDEQKIWKDEPGNGHGETVRKWMDDETGMGLQSDQRLDRVVDAPTRGTRQRRAKAGIVPK